MISLAFPSSTDSVILSQSTIRLVKWRVSRVNPCWPFSVTFSFMYPEMCSNKIHALIFPGTEVKLPGLQLPELPLLPCSPFWQWEQHLPFSSHRCPLESIKPGGFRNKCNIQLFILSLPLWQRILLQKHTYIHTFNKVSFIETIARTVAWELSTYNRDSNIRETICLQA